MGLYIYEFLYRGREPGSAEKPALTAERDEAKATMATLTAERDALATR